MKTSLELHQVSLTFAGSETDGEEFTSDIESISSEISSDEETYVIAVLRDAPIEPDMSLSTPEIDDIPDLLDLME